MNFIHEFSFGLNILILVAHLIMNRVYWSAIIIVLSYILEFKYFFLKARFIIMAVKGKTHKVFYICIYLGILPLWTELWNYTSYMSEAWYVCEAS